MSTTPEYDFNRYEVCVLIDLCGFFFNSKEKKFFITSNLKENEVNEFIRQKLIIEYKNYANHIILFKKIAQQKKYIISAKWYGRDVSNNFDGKYYSQIHKIDAFDENEAKYKFCQCLITNKTIIVTKIIKYFIWVTEN